MDAFDFLGFSERYGGDTVLVACVVVFLTCLCRKTLFRKHPRSPVLSVLPFLFGVLLLFALSCALHPSWEYLAENFPSLLRRGCFAGSLSTLETAFFSPSVDRAPSRAAIVRKLLAGFAPPEEAESLAAAVAERVSRDCTREDVFRVYALLKAYKEREAERKTDKKEEGGEEIAGGKERWSDDELMSLAEAIVQALQTTAV